jgi:hypothetical protein
MLLAPLLVVLSAPSSADSILEPPFRVRDAHGFIDVDIGHAAPLFVDFDGDGLRDLLVGQFGEGKLRIYKNVGTAQAPKFDGFTWFKAGEQEGRIPSG